METTIIKITTEGNKGKIMKSILSNCYQLNDGMSMGDFLNSKDQYVNGYKFIAQTRREYNDVKITYCQNKYSKEEINSLINEFESECEIKWKQL